MIDWATIVEQHGPDVWRTACRLLSNRDDANDCYQETFLQAVQYARLHEVACWPAVLRKITTARALDQLRRRYRASSRNEQLSLATDEPVEQSPAPDALAQLREGMEHLRHALAELPAAQAEVFWLSQVELLSHADIALQLDSTPEQIALWLHRAKQKLRWLLASRGVTNEV